MPRRPSFYILTLLLLVLIGLVYYITRAVNSPELKAAIAKAKATKDAQSQTNQAMKPVDSTAEIASNIDPELKKLADELNAPGGSPQRDLEVLREFMNLYNKAYRSGNPVGLNEDITGALTGTADPTRKGHLFPRSSPAIKNGQLVDRWGTPFWFHAESSTKMEIRSAGPDRSLFTSDDVILNP